MDEKERRKIKKSREYDQAPKKFVETAKDKMNRIISDEIPREENTNIRDQDVEYKP